jgi:uncharacterized protein (DUF58 family)
MMENKSDVAARAQLIDHIDELARQIGELDPRDPQRSQLIDEIYRLTQSAKNSTINRALARPNSSVDSLSLNEQSTGAAKAPAQNFTRRLNG